MRAVSTLICRVVTKLGNKPIQSSSNFIDYLLARHQSRILAIHVVSAMSVIANAVSRSLNGVAEHEYCTSRHVTPLGRYRGTGNALFDGWARATRQRCRQRIGQPSLRIGGLCGCAVRSRRQRSINHMLPVPNCSAVFH